MRTNIVLDDNLVDEAFKIAGNIHTKRELVETALIGIYRNPQEEGFARAEGQDQV